MSRASLISLSLALSLAAPRALAQSDDGATVRGDGIDRARREVEDGARSGTVVDLRERGRAAPALTTLLDEAPSVHARSTGDGLAPSFVSMRGAPTAQVTIAVDGVVLNDAFAPTVDLSQLAPAAFLRADVYRGAAPLRLGMQGLGGVIELHTRETAAQPSAWASAGGGSFAQRRASAMVSGGRFVRGLVALSYRGTRGDFLFFDDNATPSNLSDDTADRVRRNAQGDAIDGLFRACVSVLCVTALGDARLAGQPGPGSLQYERAYTAQGRWLARLDATFRKGAVRVQPFATLQWRRDSFGDPLRELSPTGAQAGGIAFEAGANASVHHSGVHVEAVARARYDRFETSDGGAATGAARASRTSLLAGLEAHGRPHPRLLLSGGFGFDAIDDRPELRGVARARSLISPRISARWDALDWLSIRASGAVLERAPSLIELYGLGEFVRSNSKLESESSLNADLALIGRWSWRALRARLEAGAFVRRADRLIVLTRTSALAVKALNVNAVDVWGVESQARVQWASWLALTVSYTYTRATQRTSGTRVPNVPEHDVFARLEGRWRWLRAGVEASGVTGLYFDSANSFPSPARLMLGASLGLEIPWVRGLSIEAQGSNLLDVRDGLVAYPSGRVERVAASDFGGFPLPSRAVYLSLSWTLDRSPSPSR